MNADQKKRAVELIDVTKTYRLDAEECAMQMAALLQELLDAPEEIAPAHLIDLPPVGELPTWENGDDPLVGGGLISRGKVDFTALGIWPSKPAPEAEPVAYVTGYNNGYPTVAPIDAAQVLRVGMALYTAPPEPPADVAQVVGNRGT